MCVCVCEEVHTHTHTHTNKQKQKKKTEKKPKCVKYIEFCVEVSNQNQYSWCSRTSFTFMFMVVGKRVMGEISYKKKKKEK